MNEKIKQLIEEEAKRKFPLGGAKKNYFLAGAEFRDSLSESKQMKWTKCSERLPEVHGNYVVRIGMTGEKRISFYNSAEPNRWNYDGVIEWLDESAPQPTQQGYKELLEKMTVVSLKMGLRLDKGRDYLMQVEAKDITAEDVLEAFGFNKNGIGEKDDLY